MIVPRPPPCIASAITNAGAATPRERSPGLFVSGVLPAEPTVLLILHPSRLFLLVLRRGVIASLAISAFQCYDVSHVAASVFTCQTFSDAELATGIEPVTSSLPRKCSTN